MAAAALRRRHPRPVPGRRLVGPDPQHPGVAAPPACCRVAARAPPTCPTPSTTAPTTTPPACSSSGTPTAAPVPEPAVPAPLGADVPLAAPTGLAVRSFDRDVDTAWRRTSYSSLTRVEPAAAPAVGSEPEEVPRDDEAPLPVGEPARRSDAGDSLADGRAAGRRRLRVAGPRRPRARRPRGRRPRCRAALAARRPAGALAGRRRPRPARRRAGGRDRHPARVARRATPPCATSRCATGCASSTSSCHSRAATSA